MGTLQEVQIIWVTLLLMFIAQEPVLVTSADDTPPIMEQSIIRINIIEGKTAILPCMVKTITKEMGNKYKVRWINPRKQMISYGSNIVISDRRFSIVTPFPADWNLRITRVRGTDAGEYVCQLNSEPVQEKTVFLYVQVSPSISASDDVIINEGRNMQIFCNVSGKPMPTLTWYKDGKLLPELKDEILIINNISRHMAGVFTCLAANGVQPNVSKSISVTVHFRPKVMVLSKRIGQYRYKDVILVCMVVDSPQGKVTWYKEGKPMRQNWKYELETVVGSEDQRYLRVKIRQLQSEDFGEYTCVAQNPVGYDEASMNVYEMQTPAPPTSARPDVITTTHAYRRTTMGNADKTGRQGKTGHIVVTDKMGANSQSPTTIVSDRRLVVLTVLLYLQLVCNLT